MLYLTILFLIAAIYGKLILSNASKLFVLIFLAHVPFISFSENARNTQEMSSHE